MTADAAVAAKRVVVLVSGAGRDFDCFDSVTCAIDWLLRVASGLGKV